MSAIPTCVVIDANRKVAYLGRFEEGIEVANKLAAQKWIPFRLHKQPASLLGRIGE